ncbi:unnamed protein product [Somion occarium]|uniref:Cytochrome P450 n=1 Tax=Somion occarium TaxID=3059160 RepID=A0ABP1CZN7_9APHY
MRSIPPGIPALLRGLVNLVIPIVVILGIARILSRWGYAVPTSAIIIIQSIGIIVFAAGQVWFRLWHIGKRVARSGGVMPPRWKGQRIGDADLLLEFMEIWKNGYLGDGFTDVMSKIGHTISLRILWDDSVVTTDANIIKSVLATDFNNFVKGEQFQAFMYSVLGTGVFNSDGDMWKFHRSMTRPFFSRDRIGHFDLFDRHAEVTINKIKERMKTGEAIDFQDLISRFTLDSATEFLFGSCVHSLESDLPYPSSSSSPFKSTKKELSRPEAFAKAFQESQEVISSRGRTGWAWPFFEIFSDKSAKPMRIVDDFLDPILKDALEKAKRDQDGRLIKKDNPDEVDEDETLLDHLVRFTTDPVVLHDEILNIMIAGRDTTAGTLTFLVYLLSQYPQALLKLRQEILSVVGPTRRPTYDDIREMKFLRAVINETLRLFPSVPFNVRYPVQDVLLPNTSDPSTPFFIPKMTPVAYSVWMMHRRTDYWGPDAEEFDPDRFLDERLHKYLTPNPFIFLPFNAGPRICLGQQFAYNEMSFFMVRLLQNFSNITFDPLAQDPSTRPPAAWSKFPGRKGKDKIYPKAHLTLYAHGGLWLNIEEAEASESV